MNSRHRSAIGYKKKTSLRIPLEVVRRTLNEIQREETRLRSSAKYRHSEISHVPSGDHFAALQIDLCVRGWKTFGGFTALKAISSQTIASSNGLTSNDYTRIPARKQVYYIIF